jgi:DNA invertase Pin-like site-specific DNA recombinase
VAVAILTCRENRTDGSAKAHREIPSENTYYRTLTEAKVRNASLGSGKLQMHILGAIAEFERAPNAQWIKAGCHAPGRKGHASADQGSSRRC